MSKILDNTHFVLMQGEIQAYLFTWDFYSYVKGFNVLLHLSVFLLTTTTLIACRYIYGGVFVNYIELKLDSSDGFLKIYSLSKLTWNYIMISIKNIDI